MSRSRGCANVAQVVLTKAVELSTCPDHVLQTLKLAHQRGLAAARETADSGFFVFVIFIVVFSKNSKTDTYVGVDP